MPALQELASPRPADVYLMRMYSERLQILVSKEQRRRLEREARRRHSSVASVIRDAVEAQLGGISREDRMQAVEAIAGIGGAAYLSPAELEQEIARGHADEIDRGLPATPGE